MSVIKKLAVNEFRICSATYVIHPTVYKKDDIYCCYVCGFSPWLPKNCTKGLGLQHILQLEAGKDVYVIPRIDGHNREACIEICKLGLLL